MQTITTIGLDIAKSVFQVHGVDAAWRPWPATQLSTGWGSPYRPKSGSAQPPELVVDPNVFGQCIADELARSEGAAFRMSALGAKRKGSIGKPR